MQADANGKECGNGGQKYGQYDADNVHEVLAVLNLQTKFIGTFKFNTYWFDCNETKTIPIQKEYRYRLIWLKGDMMIPTLFSRRF